MLNQRTSTQVRTVSSLLSTLMVLFKVRIVVLLLFAAIGGAFLGAGGWPGGSTLGILILTGGLAAMGSSAMNEWIERDKDALMKRTRRRPLVTGAFAHPGWVPYVSVGMIVAPILATLTWNPALAAFLALGALTYVVIYTLWLKPRTSLNIVIGGLAGSFAVLSGSAAVGAWDAPAALILAGLLFFWTPIHFWALAIVYREDYARAGVPMLPVQVSTRQAALWGLLHGVGAGVSALVLAFEPGTGPVYFVPVLIVTVALLVQGSGLVIEPTKPPAWRLFHTSNIFLAVVLLAICIAGVASVPWPW